MKTLKKTLFAFTACAIAFASCKKDDPVSTPVNTPSFTTNIKTALSNNAPQAQSFQVNAQFPTPIRTENGAQYLFSSNAFLLPNGTVAVGDVQVQITEHFKNSELVLAGLPTTSNGEQLFTGGQFFIEASQNGQSLTASPQYNLTADIPTDDPDPLMDLFVGEENADGTVNWLLAEEGNITDVFLQNDSSAWCATLCGSIPVDAGSTITITYTSGNEDDNLHAMNYDGLGESTWVQDMTDFETISFTATESDELSICLYDYNYDGWQGAYLTVDIDGESFDLTVGGDDDCESLAFGYYYQLNTTSLGWINCDYFAWLGVTLESYVVAEIPANYVCGNVANYAVFPDEDALGYVSCDGGTLTSLNMPANTDVVICSIALVEDVFYSAFASVTANGETPVTLEYTETTIDEFEAYIDGL